MALPPLRTLPPLESLPPLEEEEDKLPPLKSLPPLESLPPLQEEPLPAPTFDEPKVEFAQDQVSSTATQIEEPPIPQPMDVPLPDIRETLGKEAPAPITAENIAQKMQVEKREDFTPEEEDFLMDDAQKEMEKKGAEIQASGMSPKEFAEKEVLGTPEKDVGSKLAKFWWNIKHGKGPISLDPTPLWSTLSKIDPEISIGTFLETLGKTISTKFKRSISPNENLAIEYEKAKAGAEDIKAEKGRQREAEFAPVPIVPEAVASATAVPDEGLEPIPLATLEPPAPSKVKTAVAAVGDAMDKAVEVGPDMAFQMIGMLVEEAPELVLGGGGVAAFGKIAALGAVGQKLEQVSRVEKLLKGLSKIDKIILRKQLGITLSQRLGTKAAGLAGETAIFLTPDMLKKGELPGPEQINHTMMAVLGFKIGGKVLGAAGKAVKKGIKKVLPKEAPEVTRPITKKTLEEADALEVKVSSVVEKTKKNLNVREGLIEGKAELKDINSKIEALNSQIKRTPKGKEQNKLVNERKQLNEKKRGLLVKPKESLLKEVDNTIEEVKTVEELEAVMQTVKEEVSKKGISRLPGEVNELNQLFKKAQKKRDAIKEAPVAEVKPAEGVQPKVTEPAPKAKADEKPKGEAAAPKEEVGVVKEVEDIMKPLDKVERDMATAEGPRHRADLKEKRDLMEDEVLPRVVRAVILKKAVKKLDKRKLGYSFFRVDGRNMRGGNQELTHTGMDNAMRSTWGDLFQKDVEAEGGLLARLSKGDEFAGAFPGKSVKQSDRILNKISQKVDAKVKKMGLDKLTHHRNRLPETGTLGIDFGVVKGRPGKFNEMSAAADQLSEAAKEVFNKKLAKKHGMIYNKEKGYYVKKAKTTKDGHPSKLVSGRSTGDIGKVQGPGGKARSEGDVAKPKEVAPEEKTETKEIFLGVMPEMNVRLWIKKKKGEIVEIKGKNYELEKVNIRTDVGGTRVWAKVKTPKEVTPPESLTKKVTPKQFESKSGAQKVLRELRKEQKAASAAGASKTSYTLRKEIEFLESQHPELKPKKRKGQDASRQAERRRDKPMIDGQLNLGNPEISNQITVKATKLPDEFKSSLETFVVEKRTKDATFINVKNDPFSKPFEIEAGREIHIDSPKSEFIDPAEPQLFTGKGDPKTSKARVRERGIMSQTGEIGSREQAKLTEIQNKDAGKFQRMMDWQRKKVHDLRKLTPAKIRDWVEPRFLDKMAPIARRIEKDPQGHRTMVAARNVKGASGAADIFAKEAKNKVYETVKHDEEALFEGLIQAHRTIEVENIMAARKGKPKTQEELELFQEKPEIMSPGGLTSKEAKAYIEEVKTQQPELYARHEEAMNRYWKVFSDQIKESHKEGLISTELKTFLLENHKNYSPRLFLQHMDPDGVGIGTGGNRINVPDSGIKKLDKGSEQALISDPRFLMEQMILRNQTRIFKNKANKELFTYLEENPNNPLGMKIELPKRIDKHGQPVFEAAPPGWTRITAMEMGSPRAMLMPNEMAKFWTLSDPQISQELANVLQWVTGTRPLKALATGINPEFAVSNLPRDMVFTWFKQHKAFSPILPIGMWQLGKEMLTVSKDVFLRKGLWRDYMTKGGSMDFLTQQGAIFKRKLGEFKGPGSELMSQVGESLAYVGNTSEALTRVALMKRMLDKGYSMEEAVYIARTNLDFAQGGTYVKALDNAFPYLGAGVQGSRGIFQGFKTNPALATFKASQVITMSAGLTYWGYKAFPEMYEMISPRERESGWIVPMGAFAFEDKQTGQKRYPYLKIPKDYGQRVFASVGDALAMKMHGKNPDYQGLQMAMTDIMPVDALTQIPPTLSAFLSYVNNRDFWRKRDVWAGRKVSPQFEFYEDTPQFWVAAGEKTGLSPERLRTATGEIFPKNIYTDLMMMGWDQLQIDDKDEINRNIYEQLAKLPFSRRVLRLTWPDRKDDLEMMKDIIRLRKGGIEVPVWTEGGQPRSKKAVKNDIKKNEIKLNDWRHVNDIKLKRLMVEEFAQPDISKENPAITSFFAETGKKNALEPKRLAERYAKKKAAQTRKRKKMKTWQTLYFEVTGEEAKE